VHAGTEGASIDQIIAYWRSVESLGFEWISVWDHFYPIMGLVLTTDAGWPATSIEVTVLGVR